MNIKRNTLVFYFTQIFHSLIFTAPIWIIYYQSRISITEMSLVVSFQYFIHVLLELPSGALADLIGRRNTTLIAFVIGTIGALLFPLASELWHFLVLASLMGSMDSFRSGSEEALLYDTYKEAKREDEFGKVYANGNFCYHGGLIVGAALGGIMYGVSPALPFFAYGISLFIGTILVLLYKEPLLDSEKFTFNNYLLQIKNGTKEAFKTKYSTYLSLFYIAVGGISLTTTFYFSDYMMVELGFGDAQRGYLTALIRIINILLIFVLVQNRNKLGWTRTILFFPIVMLVGYLPGISLNGYFGLPFVQLAMIATTARWIILAPLTNEVFSSKYRATAISALSLFIGIIYTVITFSSGYIIPIVGMKTMFSMLGIVSLIFVVPLAIKLIKLRSHYS